MSVSVHDLIRGRMTKMRLMKSGDAPLRLKFLGVLPVLRVVVEAVLRRQDGRALWHVVAAYVHILRVS